MFRKGDNMKTNVFSICLVIISCGLLLATGICQSTKSDSTVVNTVAKSKKKELPVVTIEMANGSIIKFEMYPDSAPKTVARISELIQKKFYDGLTFHRVVPGFVVQGGDPLGNGTGGSGVNLPPEFNNRHHVPGTVAMARAQDPNSADCQFYICLGTPAHLDGNYTIFGQVTKGMDIVEKIKVGDIMKKVTVNIPGEKNQSTGLSDIEKQNIDLWIKKNKLNQYGDPQGTMYTGGTPLFNESTGKKIDRYQYIFQKHSDHPWNE